MPLNDNAYNIGCGVTADAGTSAMRGLKKSLTWFKETFPLTRRLMDRAERTTPTQGAALRCGLNGTAVPVAGRVVATGEVIGTTFPFTGEGIGKAMHSGRLAAEAIGVALVNEDVTALDDYPRQIQRQLAPAYRGYAVAQRWLSQPWLNDFMARRIKRSRYLQEQARDIMAETGDPRKLYAPASVIRSFFH
jgi:flavin-dependent dehydrogenase